MATENLSLELPQAQNALADDVVKIADNFQKLDTAHGTLKTAFLTAQEELKTEITDKTEQFKTAITDQQTQFQTEIDEKTTQFQEKISSEVTRVETAFTEHREAYTQTIADVRAELKSETTALRDSFNEALGVLTTKFDDLQFLTEMPYILSKMTASELDAHLTIANNVTEFNAALNNAEKLAQILNTANYVEVIASSYSAWSLFKANATAMAGLLDDTTYPNTFTWFINAADFAENAANTTGKTNAFADLPDAARTTICESSTLTATLSNSETAMTRIANDLDWLYSLCTVTTNVTARANLEIGLNKYALDIVAYATLTTTAGAAKFKQESKVNNYPNSTVVLQIGSAAGRYLCFLSYAGVRHGGTVTITSYTQNKVIKTMTCSTGSGTYCFRSFVPTRESSGWDNAWRQDSWGNGVMTLGGINHSGYYGRSPTTWGSIQYFSPI